MSEEFRLVILNQSWLESGLGYDEEPALAKIKNLDRTSPLFEISRSEVEMFLWEDQTIVLTHTATANLHEAVEKSMDSLPENIKEMKNLNRSVGLSSNLEMSLYTKCFVFLLGDQFMYGGIVLNAISQMGINFPVMRVSSWKSKVVLHLLPCHMCFMNHIELHQSAPEPVSKDIEGDWAQFPKEIKEILSPVSPNYVDTYLNKNPIYVQIKESVQASGKLVNGCWSPFALEEQNDARAFELAARMSKNSSMKNMKNVDIAQKETEIEKSWLAKIWRRISGKG